MRLVDARVGERPRAVDRLDEAAVAHMDLRELGHEGQHAALAGGSASSVEAVAVISPSRSTTIAATRSSLVGKRRNTVPWPTPARRAISAVLASRPCSAKTSAAASSRRLRLRSASARRGRVAVLTARIMPPPAPPRPHRCRRGVGGAAATTSDSAAEREQDRAAREGHVPAADEGVGRVAPSASRDVVRLADRVESTARPSAPPTCWEVLNRPGGEAGVLGGDAGGRQQRHGHERQAHADRHREQRREQVAQVAAVAPAAPVSTSMPAVASEHPGDCRRRARRSA